MDSYKIEWKHSAEKELKDIDKLYIPRILEAVEALADNPFPLQYRKLLGVESSYRIRVGDYRVIYQFDAQNKRVVIYHVRHRREAYRK
jgi:mRNA interferase RelE/StbE